MFCKSAFSLISVVEVMPVPCPHFNVKIVQRSRGQSAVAAAAYQSGSRLFSENDHKVKWYSNKKEVVHAEILFLLMCLRNTLTVRSCGMPLKKAKSALTPSSHAVSF